MPEQPTFYDPNSPNEQAPPLPSARLQRITDSISLQPPLSRRGHGPGLILLIPKHVKPSTRPKKPLDPEPVQKWAEEGFAVVGVTRSDASTVSFNDELRTAVEALKRHQNAPQNGKFGLIAYDTWAAAAIVEYIIPPEIACIVTFHDSKAIISSLPIYIHEPAPTPTTGARPYQAKKPKDVTRSSYPSSKEHFVLPNSADYDPAAANLAHTRSLVFLRKHLGGPHFDIEKIWEEHTYWEFERRSVAQTMATMVAEPYVNHVPTMTGGMGREALTAFYRDHFIFCNPPDTALLPISRTVGPDRVVDEFIFSCTHTSHIPWLLPNVPPTNKQLSIPFVGVINVRGDRLYHEHIWWDQGTALRQAGLLPSHVKDTTPGAASDGSGLVKLPVAGVECAKLLADEMDGQSNEMIGEAWARS